MKNVQTLKGFRDFLPSEARKRQYVINTLKAVFESFGFEPLETPALEYEEILLGKYGQEGDKLMYRFEDNGKRKVALRYDQTVPTSRVVAQHQNELPMPFKRYQIQPVWRAENPQKGRYREFLQCDADIIGSSSPLADAEVITTAVSGLKALGFEKFTVLINDRTVFEEFKEKGVVNDTQLLTVLRALDKIKKIRKEGVLEELQSKGFSQQTANAILLSAETIKQNEKLTELFSYLKKMGLDEKNLLFVPTLARGLDYYTSIIFEIEVDGFDAGSVCGGGRYDNLIGMFAGKNIPATGFAVGFDRLLEAMEELNLFPQDITKATTRVLVTVFPDSPILTQKSLELTTLLRSKEINTELYSDNAPLEKQLKYANRKNIPFVIIIGLNEAEKNEVTLKNMRTGEQKQVSTDSLLNEFK